MIRIVFFICAMYLLQSCETIFAFYCVSSGDSSSPEICGMCRKHYAPETCVVKKEKNEQLKH